jgi:hypothetical protein
MKKVSTIVRTIDKLEKELYTNYTNEEIYNGIIKEEAKKPFWGGLTGLVNVIAEGTYNDVTIEKEFEK